MRIPQHVSIAAGSSDDVVALRKGQLLYVVSANRRYGYFGVEVFDRSWQPVTSVFLQGEDAEYAIPNWDRLGERAIVNRLEAGGYFENK